MSEKILAALSSCGILEKYKDKFEENNVDDALLDDWIKNKEVDKYLADIINSVGFRSKFMSQYKNIQEEPPSINHVAHEFPTTLERNIESLSSSSKSSDEHENEKPLSLTAKESSEVAIKFYNEAMNNLKIDKGQFLEESILLQVHEKTKVQSVQLFQKCYNNFNSQQSSQVSTDSQENAEKFTRMLLEDLNDTIDKAFKMLKMENKLNQTNYISKANNDLANTKKLYKSKMKKLIGDTNINEEDLTAKQREVAEKVLNNLNENIKNSSASTKFIDELNSKLKSFTRDWFEEELEKFRNKISGDEFAVKEALFAIKNYYNEEMDKHFASNNYIQPSTLLELHEEISAAAVKSCRDHDLKLTHTQKKQLEEAMKVVYKKYVEKNIMRKPTSSPAIGIDLGTTYSCVAAYINGQVEVIHNQQGNKTTPSYVAFQNDLSVFVGDAAKNQSYKNPNTVYDVKRFIGRKFNDKDVKGNLKSWPFIVFEHDGKPMIKIQDQPNIYSEKTNTRAAKRRKYSSDYSGYHPEEISAHVLKEMKKIAENRLGCEVKNAVITVPALFSDSQRQATRDAGEIAGLNVMRIINEPTAASIAYNLHRTGDLKRNVLVFDLGGGTFDVAVLEIKKGEIEVKSVHGDRNLGGQDFDQEMVNHCIESFKKEHGIDLSRGQNSTDPEKRNKVSSCLRRIRSQCEENKKALSFNTQGMTVEVPNISGNLDLHLNFTRELFNSLNQKHFDRCLEIVQKALDEAGKNKGEINDIVLVGGSTRIPKIQEMLTDFFSGKVLNQSIHPDECVAVGAAIHACILNGEQVDQVRIKDVTPLSIGIKNADGEFNIEIPKNTPIPCSFSSEYYAFENYQSGVTIEVFEGEDRLAKNNDLLGSFRLSGIPGKKDEPIKIKFQINDESILSVQAVCEKQNLKNEIVISSYKNRLDREQIREATESL